MLRRIWKLAWDTIVGFIDDSALSRGASIAFFTVTALAPVLLIVIAVAGMAFGRDAASDAIVAQLSGLMGRQSAELLQTAIAGAADKSSGVVASLIGLGTLIFTASGVFGEMQRSLNDIWKAEPTGATVSRLIRARAASLGLVVAVGFVMTVSLAISAGLTALGNMINAYIPFGEQIMALVNAVVSITLIAVLFAAIYKVLPDKRIAWRDVAVGAIVTSILFNVGKSLIGWYIGSSAVASSYGAAGALIVVLLWIYYSALIFLMGAEFTKAYAATYGSRTGDASLAPTRTDLAAPTR